MEVESEKEIQIKVVMAGLMIGLLVAALDNSIMGTAMPNIISSLGGMAYYVWPFTIYMLTSTISIILFGKLSDLYGRKRVLIAGIGLFVFSSILCGISQNMFELILFRGLQGIGGGILITIPFIVVAEIFPPRQRGKYTGILASVFGLSSVLGPILGGVITDFLGWRWVFFVNIPIGILAISILTMYFPHIEQTIREKIIDYAGIISLTGSLSFLFLGLTYFRTTSLPISVVASLFILSAVMLIFFIYIERKAVEPLLPMHLFKLSVFNVSAISMFLSSAVMFCGILYIPLFLQKLQGISASGSGAIITPMLISLTLASILTGQIIARTGRYKKLGILAFVLITTGMGLLSTMTPSVGTFEVLIYTTILGIGSGMMYPVFNVAVQNAVERRDIGIVTASSQFFRNIGATVTLPIFGLIVNLTLNTDINGANNIPPEIMTIALHNVFISGFIISVLGLITCIFLKDALLSDKIEDLEVKNEKEFKTEVET